MISYGERLLLVGLGIERQLIGARLGSYRVAVEIKELRGRSVIAELEQAIGQYMLYKLL